MKRYRMIAAVTAVAALLSGCTSLSLNGRDILSPPRAAGERAEIQQMIEEDAGKSYELICPDAGDYRSGVIMRDLDRDGTDEAIALYTVSGGARILTAEKKGGSYKSIGIADLQSANIGSMRFADIDRDGTDEILISCDAGSPAASLSMYLTTPELKQIAVAQGFTDYITGDFDGDSGEDVLILTPVSPEATATAKLLSYDGSVFTVRSSCEIDPDITAYPLLQFADIGSGQKGAIADGKTEDGKYNTQLIMFDQAENALTNPLFVSANYVSYGRTVPLLSRDIDDDGVIEFPLCSLTAHSGKEDISHVCALAQWCCYDPSSLIPLSKLTTFLCEPLGFMLKLDAELSTTVTARYDGENTFTLHALTYKGTEPQLGEVLLTVKRYDTSDFDSAADPEEVIRESGSAVYTCIRGDKCPLSDKEIKNSFTLIENN